jgi:hypothetical protein
MWPIRNIRIVRLWDDPEAALGAPMSRRDDFGLWELELREQPVEPSGGRGMAITALLLILGGFGLIITGGTPLGLADLVISVLILFLWQAGM